MNQHDSSEFLIHCIDGIHEDLNMIRKKPYIPVIECDTEDIDGSIARKAWTDFLKRNYSKVSNLFYGQFRNESECPICSHKSIQYDPFQLVQLPLPRKELEENLEMNSFEISENQNRQARKIVFKVKYTKKLNPKVSALLVKYAEARSKEDKCIYPPEKFALCFSGFSTHGDTIPSETMSCHEVNMKAKDSHYRPILFLFEKTEDEMKVSASKDCISVIGLSKLCDVDDAKLTNPTFPSFSKLVYVLPQNTVEDLTFLFFLKFAHFIDANWEKKASSKKSEEEEEQFPKPVANYKEHYKNYFFNKKFHKGVLFKLMIDGKIYEHDSKVKMSTFTDESVRNWNDGLRLLKIDIILDPYTNTLNAAKISFMKKIASDQVDVSLTELLKTEEEKQSKLDIYNLLARFSKKEQLDDDNRWKCTKCDKKVNALRSIRIYRAPKILILHMKKLKEGYDRFRSGSDHLLVDFPVEGLDITNLVCCKEPIEAYNIPKDDFKDKGNEFLEKKIIPEFKCATSNLVYDCFGVVNHYGSHYFGHYTAYVKNRDNWYTYDDSSVHKVEDPKSIVTEAAYVLFYRRRDE